jgi:hypothetical protein
VIKSHDGVHAALTPEARRQFLPGSAPARPRCCASGAAPSPRVGRRSSGSPPGGPAPAPARSAWGAHAGRLRCRERTPGPSARPRGRWTACPSTRWRPGATTSSYLCRRGRSGSALRRALLPSGSWARPAACAAQPSVRSPVVDSPGARRMQRRGSEDSVPEAADETPEAALAAAAHASQARSGGPFHQRRMALAPLLTRPARGRRKHSPRSARARRRSNGGAVPLRACARSAERSAESCALDPCCAARFEALRRGAAARRGGRV